MLVRLHLECCVQFWFLQFKEDTDRLKSVWKRVTKMIKGLDSLPCKRRLKACPGRREGSGGPHRRFQYLKGSYKGDWEYFAEAWEYCGFTRNHTNTRGNKYVLHWEGLCIYIRKKFFMVWIASCCNNLPRDIGRLPIAGDCQDAMGQGARWSHQGSLPHERLDQITFWSPFQPGLFHGSVLLKLLRKYLYSVSLVGLLFVLF